MPGPAQDFSAPIMRGMIGTVGERIRKKLGKAPEPDRVARGTVEALLVSFCNMPRSRKAPMAIIDLLDESGPSYRWLSLDGKHANSGPPNHGGRALCWHGDLVCCAYRTSARVAEFALFDPANDWRFLSRSPVPASVHSAVSDGRSIYFTVSLEDSIYRAVPEKRGTWRTERYWTLPGSTGDEDESHINGIGFAGGELCVSGIGRQVSDNWAKTRGGFVYNVERGEELASGISHPHSMLYDGENIWTCSSQTNQIFAIRPEDGASQEFGFPTTYLRGFALDDHELFAGSSKRRTRSLSTGERTGVPREKRGECSVWKQYKDGSHAEQVADFSEHRDEIYDLLPVPSPSRQR